MSGLRPADSGIHESGQATVDGVVSDRPSGGASTSLRERILDSARELTIAEGWSRVTMSRLAQAVGVSRQTIYNEVGAKEQLAEALVMRESLTFLAEIDTRLRQGRDAIDAVGRAIEAAMALAAVNPLLRAVIESAHGADQGLLPLVTTRSQPIVAGATEVIARGLGEQFPDFATPDLKRAVDVLVRLTLSHILQPMAGTGEGRPSQTVSGPPGQATGGIEDIAWVAERLLTVR